MYIKKCLFIFALVLLLSTIAMRGMEHFAYDDSLHCAIINNNYAEFINFLDAGVSIESLNEPPGSITPIMRAALNKDFRFLKELVKRKANINFTDDRGETALHYACYEDETVKNVKILIKAGANIECCSKEDGSRPIRRCFWQKEIMQALIERGANVEFPFEYGICSYDSVLSMVEHMLSFHEKRNLQDGIDTYSWYKNLLVNAPQIRANYLKKQTEKTERKCKTEAFIQKLENIKADRVLKINGKDFKIPTPILLVRCNALLKF